MYEFEYLFEFEYISHGDSRYYGHDFFKFLNDCFITLCTCRLLLPSTWSVLIYVN